MNGLSLRINASGKNKTKNTTLGLQPTVFDVSFLAQYGELTQEYFNFMNSSTVDEQLTALKEILKEHTDGHVTDLFIIFIVKLFLETEQKHAVKCFLTKYIIKTKHLYDPFKSYLKSELSQLIALKGDSLYYTEVCMKLSSCLENFPPGELVVRALEVDIACFLKEALECCINVLSNSSNLSPTKKNELYNSSHLILRLINNIISKCEDSNRGKLVSNAIAIRTNIRFLFQDDDTPMDTKSLCGIVVLVLHEIEFGDVIHIISPPLNSYLHELLSSDVIALCFYSALVTSKYSRTDVIVEIARRIFDIGERSSSSPLVILSAARTFLSISRVLPDLELALGCQVLEVAMSHVWGHLDHHLDSVRHLAAQTLRCLVKYCCRLSGEGQPAPLEKLLKNVLSLENNSKSYYLSMMSLVVELGATYVLDKVEGLIKNALEAVNVQHIQASSTTFLETLLDKHTKEADTARIYETWIEQILRYVTHHSLEAGTLIVMEGLVVRAVGLDSKLMDYIIPKLKSSQKNSSSRDDIICTLMLLSVVRKSNVCNEQEFHHDDQWKDLVTYDELKEYGVHIDDEIRLLSLTLIIESIKTTEIFTKGDLDFVFHFLVYNINSQSANFRQIMLSMLKKFTRRLQDSCRLLNRQREKYAQRIVDYYLCVDTIRYLCLKYLRLDGSYSRKYVGLQLVLWFEEYKIDGYENKWSSEECNNLFNIFEDTFESIQILALDVLKKLNEKDLKITCGHLFPHGLPSRNDIRFLSKYYEDIDMRTNGYTTAGYVLRFVDHARRCLTNDDYDKDIPDLILLNRFKVMTSNLKSELSVARDNILRGALKAPMYGYLHILTHLMKDLQVKKISSSAAWATTFNEIIQVCIEVCEVAGQIVNNDSPEGYLGIGDYLQLDNGDVEFVTEFGRQRVSPQAVLGCTWRSVKEVSLLLGEISSKLPISPEDQPGLLNEDQIRDIGDLIMDLLTHTKHRGAFEQAYLGFIMLCNRLWLCRSNSLLSLPKQWSDTVWSQITRGETSATRRSAGLPYIVQALVTTELQITGNTRCFLESMTKLLELASTTYTCRGSQATRPEDSEPITNADCSEYTDSRVHSLNILRALYRNTALGNAVTKYVGAGFIAAIRGFDADTWAERNASTLLFSALMVRTFGVTRTKELDKLERSNKMTGRIFFLRYPQLYDFMLESLGKFEDPLRCQSVGPLLDVLARLYPSSLEGTHSNLKLSAFVPLVGRHSSSCVMKIRISAARALVPLLMPAQVLPQIVNNFKMLSDENIKRNQCHGLLLQVSRLLSHNEDDIKLDAGEISSLSECLQGSLWILRQAAGILPCFIIADEYIKVISLMFSRFPELISSELLKQLEMLLYDIIFNDKKLFVKPGRELCLSNAVYFSIAVMAEYEEILQSRLSNRKYLSTESNLNLFLKETLRHESYEVKLTTLNSIGIFYHIFSFKTHLPKSLERYTCICNRVTNHHDIKTELMNIYHKVEIYEIKQKILRLILCNVECLSENELTRKFIEKINEKTCTEDSSCFGLVKDLMSTPFNIRENVNYREYMLPIAIDALSRLFMRTSTYKDNFIHILDLVWQYIENICTELYTYNDDVKNSIMSLLENDIDTLFCKITYLSNKAINQSTFRCLCVLINDEDEAIRNRTSALIWKLMPDNAVFTYVPCRSYEKLAKLALFLHRYKFFKQLCSEEDIFDNDVINSYSEQAIWKDIFYDKKLYDHHFKKLRNL